MTFLLCTGLVINLIAKAAQFERSTFTDPRSYAAMIAILIVVAILIRSRNRARARSPEGELQFEEAADPAILALGLHWDGKAQLH